MNTAQTAEHYYEMAQVLARQGDHDAALALVGRLLRLQPTHGPALRLLDDLHRAGADGPHQRNSGAQSA